VFSQAEFSRITMPADSNGCIQYNYNGQFAGATAAMIKDSTLLLMQPNTTTAPTSGSKVYQKVIANHGFLNATDALSSYELQTFMGNRTIVFTRAHGGGSSSKSDVGGDFTNGGASTNGRAVTTSDNFKQRTRLGFTSSAATNSSAWITSSQNCGYISSGSGYGGFFITMGFGISDATFQDSTRLFVGVTSGGVPSASADPSNIINCIGIGSDALDSTINLMFNDASGTCTVTSLGSDFKKTTSNVTWYRFTIYNPQGSGVVYYEALNCLTGTKVTGSINSNLPATTQTLSPIIWRNTGRISTAIAIDYDIIYTEREY
jgi:hypothetical protein